MFTNIKNKLSNMSAKDWIVVSLWLGAFILLIAFVICAAVIDKDAGTSTRHMYAQTGVHVALSDAFGKTATGTVGSTAIAPTSLTEAQTQAKFAKVLAYTVGENKVFDFVPITGVTAMGNDGSTFLTANLAEYEKAIKGVEYATGLATTGTLFAVSLIAAMFTTTFFAWAKKRKGGK